MPLFDLEQDYEDKVEEWKAPTFKDCAAADIGLTFFDLDEHADLHTVDGKECPIILEQVMLKEHSSHWEGGAKQNFDNGLYSAYYILYVKVKDYGARPKIGKLLYLDKGTKEQRIFSIESCEDEAGVYRMTMKRTRQ